MPISNLKFFICLPPIFSLPLSRSVWRHGFCGSVGARFTSKAWRLELKSGEIELTVLHDATRDETRWLTGDLCIVNIPNEIMTIFQILHRVDAWSSVSRNWKRNKWKPLKSTCCINYRCFDVKSFTESLVKKSQPRDETKINCQSPGSRPVSLSATLLTAFHDYN